MIRKLPGVPKDLSVGRPNTERQIFLNALSRDLADERDVLVNPDGDKRSDYSG
jgi:hypothetical protein